MSDFDPTSHADFGAAIHTAVVRTVVAPLSIVVQWGGGAFVCSFVVLFFSGVCDLFLFDRRRAVESNSLGVKDDQNRVCHF